MALAAASSSWSVAAAWGCKRTGTGKVAWFDVPVPFDDASPRGTKRRSSADPYPNGVPIALLEAPIQEMIRTAAHYDALYREVRLTLELDPAHLDPGTASLAHPLAQLSSHIGFYGLDRLDEVTLLTRDNGPHHSPMNEAVRSLKEAIRMVTA
jgi:hypothetical protein